MTLERMEHDQTKLTQFARPSFERQSPSQSFFTRLFGRSREGNQGKAPAISYAPAKQAQVLINVAEHEPGFHTPDREQNVNPEAAPTSQRRSVVREEIRTFTNVLGRLMNILDKKSSFNEGIRPYKDSEFRQSWMPDSSCKECYDCSNKFTTFLRRHHCRICGQIFCSSCCNQEVPGRVIGFEGGLRACTYCCGVVSQLMEGLDDDLGTLRDNVKAQLSQSTATDLRGNPTSGTFTPSRRLSHSDSFETPINRTNHIASVFDIAPAQEPMEDMTNEERQSLVKDSLQLKSLFFEMLDAVDGVQLTSKRHRLRTYPDCFHGCELITWLTYKDKAQDRHQAAIIGQALLDAKYVQCLTDASTAPYSSDYTLYQFRRLSHSEQKNRDQNLGHLSAHPEVSEDVPSWIQELEQCELDAEQSMDFGQYSIQSASSTVTSERGRSRTIITDVTFEESAKVNVTPSLLSENNQTYEGCKQWCKSELCPGRHGGTDQFQCAKEDGVAAALNGCDPYLSSAPAEHLSAGDQQTQTHNQFKILYKEHVRLLCAQLLEKSQLSTSWVDILLDLSSNISHFVKPDVCLNKDLMDIGPYVHIKKVRSGEPGHSAITYGTICTKSVIHCRMRTSINSPKIMLLQSSIEYQRVTNKLSSLDPQILQEREYLHNCVARICRYKPDVLLVENTVSRVAQQLLLEAGITVVINVKTSVMQRIARMTMADIIPSIDSLISPPQLGTCYKFQTDLFRFHDGYYKTLMVFSGCPANLGCTVLLRGPNFDDLVKVKRILMILTKACYYAKLEISYFIDQSAAFPTEKSIKAKRRHHSGESRESVDSSEATQEPATFTKLLTTMVLDYSPLIRQHTPYFETSKGRKSSFRYLFPDEIYWSSLLAGSAEMSSEVRHRGINEMYNHKMDVDNIQTLTAVLSDPHKFVVRGLNCSVKDKRFKDLCANYRSSGSRLTVKSDSCDRKQLYHQPNASPHPEQQLDCFDVDNHQKISVLFSSYTTDPSPQPCVKPWIVEFHYYGRQDIPLGQFLELYCFRPDYPCPNAACETSMLEHIRRFVHGSSSLCIVVRSINKPDTGNTTTTWRWCKKCRKATSTLPLSPSTWHMSFARFLQIQFNSTLVGSQVIEECTHSMSKDYDIFFRFKNIVAAFTCSSIILRDVVFPSPQIAIKHKISKDTITSQIGIVLTHGLGLFSEVIETYYKLDASGLDSDWKRQLLIEHKKDLEKEKSWFTHEIDRIQTECDDVRVTAGPNHTLLQPLEDDIIRLKCHLAKSVQQWNMRIDTLSAKEDKLNEKRQRSEVKSLKSETLPIKEDCSSSNLAVGHNSSPIAVSSVDPDGPVVSTMDEVDTRKPDTDSASSLNDSTHEETLKLNSSTELDLADYHQCVNQGLRAGVHRNSTLTSAGSVDSYVVCAMPDTPDLSSKKLNIEHENGSYQSSTGNSAIISTGTGDDFVLKTTPRDVSASGASQTHAEVAKEKSDEADSKVTKTNHSENLDNNETHALSLKSPSSSDVSIPDRETPGRESSSSDLQQPSFHLSESDTQLSVSVSATMLAETPEFGMSDELNPDSSHFEDKDLGGENGEEVDLTSTSVVLSSSRKSQSSQPRFNSGSDTDRTMSPGMTRRKQMKKSGSRYFIDRVASVLSSQEDPAAAINPIENPFSDNEHFLLQPTVSVPVIVFDEEPSSIVAYALGSQLYEEKRAQQNLLLTSNGHASADPSLPLPEKDPRIDDLAAILELTSVSSIASNAAYARGDVVIKAEYSGYGSQRCQSDFDFDDVDQFRFGKPKDRAEVKLENQHIEMQFTEKSQTGEKIALFYCKVYFAADFEGVRKLTFPEGENQFIRSLSRCYKWIPTGGKSASGFCKTLDDRFIMKQMGRQEIQSFIEFGPHYFEYLTETMEQSGEGQGKCALAKIVGVYRIGLKNFVTNAALKQDVLIMENLFYGRSMGRIYDLKGSDRNRLIKKGKSADAVLLDENFMTHSKQNPLYVREHTKQVLMNRLVRDCQLLAKHTIIDYSLLCGYDKETNEIVIGIIDYIRTFTFDKKLEFVVKSSGLLGGQGKKPTIVSPEVYRTRFIEAMERYFNVVADGWSGFAGMTAHS